MLVLHIQLFSLAQLLLYVSQTWSSYGILSPPQWLVQEWAYDQSLTNQSLSLEVVHTNLEDRVIQSHLLHGANLER